VKAITSVDLNLLRQNSRENSSGYFVSAGFRKFWIQRLRICKYQIWHNSIAFRIEGSIFVKEKSKSVILILAI